MPQDPSTQRTKAQRTMSETSVSKHRGTKVNEHPPQGRTKKRSSHTALSPGPLGEGWNLNFRLLISASSPGRGPQKNTALSLRERVPEVRGRVRGQFNFR